MARSFMVRGGAYLNVDLGDVARTIELMRGLLTKEQFDRLLYRTFGEVGRRGATIISRAVRQDYVAQDGWIRSQIERPKLSMGGAFGVECRIPINGAKGVLGPRFPASGGRRGRRMTASIVRSGRSRLPAVMRNQGGQPPFMAKGVGFTRRTKARLPIVRVVGLGVPQMPLNRSADEVQDQILDLCGRRLEHNFMHMFGSGR